MTHDEKLIKDRAYKAAHREELRLKALAYYQRTKDNQREYRNAMSKARYHADLDYSRAKRRKWYASCSKEYLKKRIEKAKEQYARTIERKREVNRARYWRTHDKRLADARRYYFRHREELLAKGKARNRADVVALKDWYIKMLLKIKDCPAELIEAKRELVKLRRIIRDYKQD